MILTIIIVGLSLIYLGYETNLFRIRLLTNFSCKHIEYNPHGLKFCSKECLDNYLKECENFAKDKED